MVSEKSAYIYVSQASTALHVDAIDQLAQHAAKANRDHGITGYLFYNNKLFLQYFEGPADHTEQLMANIEKDDRHQILRVEVDTALTNYRFLSWHMKNIALERLREINFEQIVIDYMTRFTASKEDSATGSPQRIWKMADIIAHKQWQLA